MCPRIDANWTDREEGKQEGYEEDEKDDKRGRSGGDGSRYVPRSRLVRTEVTEVTNVSSRPRKVAGGWERGREGEAKAKGSSEVRRPFLSRGDDLPYN